MGALGDCPSTLDEAQIACVVLIHRADDGADGFTIGGVNKITALDAHRDAECAHPLPATEIQLDLVTTVAEIMHDTAALIVVDHKSVSA